MLHELPNIVYEPADAVSIAKRAPAYISDHPPSTVETACLYLDEPNVPGSSGEGGANLEASPVHYQGRRSFTVGIIWKWAPVLCWSCCIEVKTKTPQAACSIA